MAAVLVAGLLAASCAPTDSDNDVEASDRTSGTTIDTNVANSAAPPSPGTDPEISEPAAGLTIVRNANVYTVDPARPTADAFAYDAAGVIVAVGTEDDVLAEAGPNATVIDAGGHMVLPGFQDTHLHVPEAGINENLCLLDPDLTLADYEEALYACVDEQPDSTWVRAAGASLFNLRDADELPIDVLDRVVPDRPALVLDDLGHAAWTNHRGLEAAGIGPDDPNPQGGVLHRDPETGALTGLLLEDAQQPVRNAAKLDDEANYAGLLVALDELAANGLTSVSDAGGYWQQNHPAAWKRAQTNGTLNVRAVNALYLYPSMDIAAQLDEFRKRFSNEPGNRLKFNTAKIYIDGILDLGTASMLEPYDEPVDPAYPSGFNYFAPDQLATYVSELHAMGYKLHFHVIGDAATRAALDAIEGIDADAVEIADRHHRLTHTYLVDSADVARFAQLGVVADFQVGPESSATDYHEYLSEFIGDRAFELIPVKTLLDSGAHISLSSDWDADPLSPFGIIQRAATRDENAVGSVAEAIRLVTLDAAYALSQEETTGSITVGKLADYVIIDQDLLAIDVNDIDATNVLLTVVGGLPTFATDQFAG